MKVFKSLLVLVLVSLTINGCSKNDIVSYAFKNVSAPSNVLADFDITQDDTGLVTITPSGDGASIFKIFFGDTTKETPTDVAPGKSVQHTYAEGSYIVKVQGVGSTGLISEYSQKITIAFRAPKNLTVSIVQNPVNPAIITVSATADFATLFNVYFGDVVDEVPTTIMPGNSIEHTYTTPGNYSVRVVAKGAGVETAESTQSITILAATDPVTLPIDFESFTVNYGFSDFGNATSVVIDNPNSGGIDTSNRVAQLTKASGSEVWAGSYLQLQNPIDFSTKKLFKVKVFSPKSGITVKLKVENATDPNTNYEVDVTNTVANDWEELTFDFSKIDITKQYHKVVIFFDFGNAGDGSKYLFDDIRLVSAGPVDVLQMPIDFESSTLTYTWNGFGSSSFGPIPASVIANPNKTGINTSANVLEITKESGAQTWAGASMDLAGAVDFSKGTTVKVKVWSPRAGTPILFKMEDSTSPKDNNGNPTVFVEVTVNSTVAGGWEELTFDLTTSATFSTSNSYDRVILFPDFGNAGTGESFYFDDLILTN